MCLYLNGIITFQSFVYLQTAGKAGAYTYDIHFWLGKDTSQVLHLFVDVFSNLFIGYFFMYIYNIVLLMA